jgi:hypothetical protein
VAFRAAVLKAERRILAAPAERQEALQLRKNEIMAQAVVVVQALKAYCDTPAVAALFDLCQIDLTSVAQVQAAAGRAGSGGGGPGGGVLPGPAGRA